MSDTTVSSGVTSSGLVLSNGDVLNVLSGGTAISTKVSAGGAAYVSGGGSAIGTTVYLGGNETVLAGGVTSGARLDNGMEYVSSGGTAEATLVGVSRSMDLSIGDSFVYSGGVTSGDIIAPQGYESVAQGGTAISTIVRGGVERDLGTTIGSVISGGVEFVSSFDSVAGVASAAVIEGGTLDLGLGATAADGIIFGANSLGLSPSMLEISGTVMPSTAIIGFSGTDAIDLASVSYTGSGTVSLNSSTNILTVTENGSSYDLQLFGHYAGTTFSLTPDAGSGTSVGITNVPCFATGTRIMTPRGDIAVEALVIGDLIHTHGGGLARATWIGHRRVDCCRHVRPTDVWPVRISSDTFGQGMPRRDLFLSPDHAVLVQGVLIPIKHLINGSSIVQVPVDEVTYYHVELPEHDVLVAEGLPAESYLNTGDSTNFSNGGEVTRLFPDFSARALDPALIREAKSYAPLVVCGPELEAARRIAGARMPSPVMASASAA
jgi:autotransporter passenger strand-loop-strand repeat protein